MTTAPIPTTSKPYTNKVYSRRMSRTNIDIDDELVATVMRRYGLIIKKDAVDYALRNLAGQPPLTTDEILAMQGAGLIEFPVDDQFVPPSDSDESA
jgi:Arc/MetJ family transcription regulator